MAGLRKHRKNWVLPITTLGVFIAITFIVVFAKASVNTDYDNSIPAANYMQLLLNPELNANEQAVLTRFGSNFSQFIVASDDTPYVLDSLYHQLGAYLASNGVNLTEENAEQAKLEIDELNRIIQMEGNRDLKEMTLDARGIATHLSQLIYQSCGLKLSFDLSGNIETISRKDGVILYQKQNSMDQDGLHIQALAITLTLIIILLLFCTQIARKHQLFHRDEPYDSFDEEKYA